MERLWENLEPAGVSARDLAAARWALDDRADRCDLTGDACYPAEAAGVGPGPRTEGPCVPAVVQTAEERLLAFQTSKTARWAGNDPAFHRALIRLLLGAEAPLQRLGAVSASGGAGAARLALDLLHVAHPDATLWLPDRGSTVIAPLARAAGVRMRSYRMFRPAGNALWPEQMLGDLRPCAPGDVVFVQGCGHDPSGLDMPEDLWEALADLAQTTGAVPFVEMSGHGLARGLAADAAGLRRLCRALPEAVLSVDCGPGFGLGRDGAGLVVVQAETPSAAHRAQAHLARLSAEQIGTLPDHGAQIVTSILHSHDLRLAWTTQLRRNRQNLRALRNCLAGALQEATSTDRWDYLDSGHGLFCQLPLRPDQLATLRDDHGFHACPDGRINLSVLDAATAARLAQAVAVVLRPPPEAPVPAATASATTPTGTPDAAAAQPSVESDG